MPVAIRGQRRDRPADLAAFVRRRGGDHRRHGSGVGRSATVAGMDIEDVSILAPAAAAVFPVEVPVVALVASAGGLDALSRVLAPLPVELPAAVLVVLHQDPTRASQLAGILGGHTALPVRAVRDGDRLQVGQVLVTPPAAHLIVTATGVL